MPKKMNGHSHGQVNPHQQLAKEILEQFRLSFMTMVNEKKAEPILLSRLSVVALTQLAAVIAIDVGMQSDQFINISRCNFDEALKRAPRFS